MPFTKVLSHPPPATDSTGSLSADIDRLAQMQSHLIVEGEPGAGKRYCAFMVHLKRPRGKRGNFVEITPAMSEEEMRVILFDEDRRRQEGVLGRPIPKLDAHATLFIRRFREFSLLEQTRIARFLIQLAANAAPGRPMVRVIASSTIPGAQGAQGNQIVESLARHLAGFERFVIPPLRERSQDIPGIVAAILRELSRKPGMRVLRVDAETLEALSSHHWWDNVRELRLTIEEAAVMSTGDSLRLPPRFFDESEMVFELLRTIQSGQKSSIEDALGFLEKTIVQRALMHTGFDFAGASRLLNLTEQNLRYRIKKHSIYIPAIDK